MATQSTDSGIPLWASQGQRAKKLNNVRFLQSYKEAVLNSTVSHQWMERGQIKEDGGSLALSRVPQRLLHPCGLFLWLFSQIAAIESYCQGLLNCSDIIIIYLGTNILLFLGKMTDKSVILIPDMIIMLAKWKNRNVSGLQFCSFSDKWHIFVEECSTGENWPEQDEKSRGNSKRWMFAGWDLTQCDVLTVMVSAPSVCNATVTSYTIMLVSFCEWEV